MTRELRDFQFRLSSLNVRTEGSGTAVKSWTLNGQEMPSSLQIPEMALRPGRNEVVVHLGESPSDALPRLYAGDAQLLDVRQAADGSLTWHFCSAVPAALHFQGDAANLVAQNADGSKLEVHSEQNPRIAGTTLHLRPRGDFFVRPPRA
jgi:hypothetical protein